MTRPPLPPKAVIYGSAVLVALSLVPLGLVARARYAPTERPPIHIVPDMDTQQKWVTQGETPLFRDHRTMRSRPDGTVARGELPGDSAFETGKEGSDWVEKNPLALSMKLLRRGQDRFAIYCSPCHGYDGRGNGMVARRALRLGEELWVPPTDLTSQAARDRQDGHLFNSISNGIRNMPGYGPQIPTRDRWAIVAYLRALQLSQNASIADVPAERRASLK